MKRCVITGAAGGIGAALAREFSHRDFQVMGIDRDAESLASVIDEEDLRILADLASPDDCNRILQSLTDSVDVFIHCAGVNVVGPFAAMPSDQQRWITEVNLVAPIALTQGLLTRELLAPSASLVFVSSLSSFVSYPGAAVYAASKEGLASYARSLRAAPVMRGRHVLTVYPGPTRTAMAERCSPDNSEPLRARRMPPERLAGSIARAVESRQPALIPGFSNRLLAQLGRWIPGVTEHAMRHAIFEKLPSGKR